MRNVILRLILSICLSTGYTAFCVILYYVYFTILYNHSLISHSHVFLSIPIILTPSSSRSPPFGQCRRPPLYTFNFNFHLPSISVFIYIPRSKPAKPRQGLRSPDFFHFFITFRNDVVRSFLRFIIGLREVLPHDTDAEQLNRADEDDCML